MQLVTEIENSSAHRPIRDKISNYVLENPDSMGTLVGLALDTSSKHHHKACWNLELVLEQQIGWIAPFMPQFCDALPRFADESAIRSISKITMFIARNELGRDGKPSASDSELEQMTAAAFDWLIADHKVATKAYAMRALFWFGNRYAWIYPELKAILTKDFASHSAAYQAAAKQLLPKL